MAALAAGDLESPLPSGSDVGSFIDAQPVGRNQIKLLLTCAAVLFFDGFDTQAIGYVAPALARTMGLSRAALGPIFSAGLFGLMIGALVFGPLADRVGRKRIIVLSVVAFGLGTLATAFAYDTTSLLILRFLTGLGLGGAMPNAVALTSEFSPKARRATMVMAMFCGFSVGAALGGLIAAALIPAFGWRSVFIVGGIAPLLLAPYLVRALPESVRFLVLSDDSRARVAATLGAMFPARSFAADTRFAVHEPRLSGMPVAHLFSEDRATVTLLLWVVFFASLLNLYFLASWLPTVVNDLGASFSLAAVVGAMLQVGGVIGTLTLGRFIDRFSFRALAITYLLASIAIAGIGAAGQSIPLATVAIFFAGFCIVGGQIAANALAAEYYPTAVRSTGVGWALGIGRAGSIVGPLVGGALLGLHWETRSLFFVAAVPALCAALAALLLSRVVERSSDAAVDPAAGAVMSGAVGADAQVAIVGGGPVGTGLAIALAQRKIRCVLVERFAHPQPIPKGQNLTQRTMEHFHFWGAEKDLRAARTIPHDYGIGGLTAYRTLLGDYSYDWLQRDLVRPYYFADNERLPQYATEEVLRKRVAELADVEALYGWTAEDVSQDEGGAHVTVVARKGSERRTLRADYVVGCDGSRSITRERAGITQTRTDHDRLMVLLVFRSNGLHELLKRFPGKSFYCVLHPDLQGYWRFFGRVDLGTTWFFHAPVPAGTTKDNFDFRGLLHAAAGAEFDITFDHIGFWDLRFAVADTYGKGRVFVAGDAAHSHPPYGGYGINTGFEDAANLGWKLAATLQGWAGQGLLTSYDEERRPVFQSTSRTFIEGPIDTDREFLRDFDPARDREAFERQWGERASGARSEVGAFEPNYEGSPIVWGPAGGVTGAVGAHAFAARAGHHLPPQPLSSGRNVFEELGQGFTLLALDADRAVMQSFEQAAKALRVPLKIIADGRSGGREHYATDFVLIRPDQFVAWTSNGDAVDGEQVLRRAIGDK